MCSTDERLLSAQNHRFAAKEPEPLHHWAQQALRPWSEETWRGFDTAAAAVAAIPAWLSGVAGFAEELFSGMLLAKLAGEQKQLGTLMSEGAARGPHWGNLG